ncbi:MAG: 2-phospho-L-lactate guanylyltransferase [Acidimicrobiia bacterium]
MAVLVGVPIKPFGSAKSRLSGLLDDAQRKEIARYLAIHTLATLRAVGSEPLVLAADDEVAHFATELGHQVLTEPGPGLNRSATQFRDRAADLSQAWLVVHADLPYLTSEALVRPLRALERGRPVIAPSPDGGTPLLGHVAHGLAFSYGPASFGRHLRQMPDARVFADPRLCCDIDRPRDLEAARARIDRISTLLGS